MPDCLVRFGEYYLDGVSIASFLFPLFQLFVSHTIVSCQMKRIGTRNALFTNGHFFTAIHVKPFELKFYRSNLQRIITFFL